MELSPRKQAVLKAIIKAYIETGEPIGSKNLAALLENAPSSATLRNEMSELCDLGLLQQPHTSAGRVPTSDGYKIYVDSLMPHTEPSATDAQYIDANLEELHCEPESIPVAAAQILSKLTGLPTIACLLTENQPRVKSIELLPIGRFSVMLLIITDDGRTRSRIFRYRENFTDKLKSEFNNIINQRIKGKYVNDLNKAYMQSVIAQSGIYSLDLLPLLNAVFETVEEIEEAYLTLKGEKALYNVCGSDDAAARILSLIKQRDPIISILEKIDGSSGAIFGTETGYGELREDTLIAAKWGENGRYRGYIGVIGPNRMSYEQIMPVTEYTAKRLTEIMTEAQKDMED